MSCRVYWQLRCMSSNEKNIFLNRELQWLEFNRRVLNEARDPRTPLLERLNFLGIFTSNLDEFVMKRIGGLKHQLELGISSHSHDGRTTQQVLIDIRAQIQVLIEEQATIYKNILPELEKHGIVLKKWKDLSVKEREFAEKYYQSQVFPVLTPLVVDPALPFPFISNLSLSLGMCLQEEDSEDILFARVKVPEVFPQWLELDIPENKNKNVFVSLVQLIQYNVADLFPDMKVLEVMPFRVTRNADLERDEEDAEDLLEMIAEEIKQRRFAEAVRLEHGRQGSTWMVQFLKEELQLVDEEIFEVRSLLDYRSLKPIYQLNLPHLKYKHWEPQTPESLVGHQGSFFEAIQRQDFLVHHPYESFPASVEKFIAEASDDPDVLAIKMTLYRMGDNNPIVHSLIRAANSGKQVVCIVELKARFDEQRNIYWAQMMEKAGIHVVYGVIGFKTHCKTTLVLRREGNGINAYAHIGTGNYNNVTSRFYTDVGLFTAHKKITDDLVQLFHLLTGRSFKRKFTNLFVSPKNMRDRFVDLVRREMSMAEAGKSARIIVKCNSLDDKEMIELLYEASQKGVHIDLLVRGFCTLRPGVKGLSEHIRVISIIGRFLEHSRIFYFQNGKEKTVDGDYYIGSADWMSRNLNARVEVVVPIFERKLKRRLWEILNTCLSDYRQVWEMESDGKYIQRDDESLSGDSSSQEKIMQFAQIRSQPLSSDTES